MTATASLAALRRLAHALPLAALGAAPVLAASHSMSPPDAGPYINTGRIEGEVYALPGGAIWSETTLYEEIDSRWEDIGDIEAVLLDHSGKLAGIVVEIGGFLGIGEHEVMIPASNIRLVPEGGLFSGDDWAVVTDLTKELLEQLPEVDDDLVDD